MRKAPILTFVLLLCLSPASAQAQSPDRVESPALSLVPFLGVSHPGALWKSGNSEFGPGPIWVAGASLGFRLTGRTSGEIRAAYSRPSYDLSIGGQSFRPGGRIDLLRLHAGLLHRLRSDVPGYFSAGIGVTVYHPAESILMSQEGVDVPLTGDRTQWIPAFHLGAGIDLHSGEEEALRLDFRANFSRPTQDPVAARPPLPAELSPRLATEFVATLGYRFRLR